MNCHRTRLRRTRKPAILGEFYYDSEAGEKAVEFFPLFLKHYQGPLAGQPFELLDWQKVVVRDLFGWKRADGTRKYRTAYIEVPRKNGKSMWAAGIALYLLVADGEQGGQIYSAATTREQASLVYQMAAACVRADDDLSSCIKVRDSVKRMMHPKSNSFYRAIAADAAGSHGFNAHGIIFDEVHQQPDRELWDVLQTSTGARRQPLTLAITTAGHDRSSICYELHQYAKSIIAGLHTDESFYPVIFGADPDEDWTDPEVWAKANPSLGHAVSVDYLQTECDKAKQNPAYENTFRNLHLNQWTEQQHRIIPMADWDTCGQEFSPSDLLGTPCYAGLDLASTRDVTALTLVWNREGTYYVKPYFWMPERAVDNRAGYDRATVQNFIDKGVIETTAGEEVNVYALANRLVDLIGEHQVTGLGFDPWNATALMQQLQDQGVPGDILVKLPQTFSTYNEPFKKLVGLVASHKVCHGGNEVLRWMASNTAHKEDPSGNIRPDKGRSGDKIDGICALLMGMALELNNINSAADYIGSGELFTL